MAPHYSAKSAIKAIKNLLQGLELTNTKVPQGEQADVIVNWFKNEKLVSVKFLVKDSENIEFSRDYKLYHPKFHITHLLDSVGSLRT